MIDWLHPAALAGMLALAGPILLHLLRRPRADRVLFPSLRFVRASRTAAIRLRLPSDHWLLALRLAVIAAAVLALSQPLLVSADRQYAWNSRLARAIVIDTSVSMTPVRVQASEAARAETQGAFRSIHIEAADVATGLRRAATALDGLPPARREIVVISDFQRGALSASALDALPAEIGLRFVQLGRTREAAEFAAESLVGTADVPTRTQTIRLVQEGTLLTLIRASGSPAGLRFAAAPRDEAAVDMLLRSVARSGAPSPSASEPIVVVFRNAVPPANMAAIDRPWMLRTILRMSDDVDLAEAAFDSEANGTMEAPGAAAVVRDRTGKPLVIAGAADGHLVLGLTASPSAFVAAAAVRSVLHARVGRGRWAEQEVARIPPERLAAWSRAPGPVPPPNRQQTARGDAKWLWVAVLVLLAVEGVVRRGTRSARGHEAYADAA